MRRAVSFQQFSPRDTKIHVTKNHTLSVTKRKGGSIMYLIHNSNGVPIALDFGSEANEKTESLLKWIEEEAPKPNKFFT